MRHFSIAAVGLITAVGLFLVGCAGSDGNGTAATPTPATTSTTAEIDHSGHGAPSEHSDHSEHGDHAEHSGDDAMAKMKAGLATLPEEDRASAEKQHMCPVSDQMLGTMGAPIKLTLNDQEVWICCNGCRKKAEADPETILAKLSK